jgi:regulator of sigma E protease
MTRDGSRDGYRVDIGTYILGQLQGVWYVAEVVIIIGILIIAHELGHFIAAKLTGMRVDEFAVGFGKKLISWERSGTVYSINLIPIGGYNKIYGMDVETPEEAEKRKKEEQEKKLKKGPRYVPPDYSLAPSDDPQAFVNRPLWQRMIVVVTGPIANIIVAVLVIFLMGVTVGFPAAELGEVVPGGPAAVAGLMKGDIITTMNGVRIASTSDLHRAIAYSNGKPLYLKGLRRSTQFEARIIPQAIRLSDSYLCRLGFAFLVDGTVIDVFPGSPAERGGLQFGDTVLAVDGTPFPSHRLDVESGNGVMDVSVYRGYNRIRLEIEYFDDEFVRGPYNRYGFMFGDDKVVTWVLEGGLADDAGLAVGDTIVEASWQTASTYVEGNRTESESDLFVIFTHEGEVRHATIKPDMALSKVHVLMDDASLPILVHLPYDHRLYQAGLRSGDEIKSVEGVPTPNGITAFLEMNRRLGKGVTIVAMSGGEERIFQVPLPSIENFREATDFFNGLHFRTRYFRAGLPASMMAGIRKTEEVTGFIFLTIRMLLSGQASISDLSGPVGIANITYEAASSGLVDLINILVLLTINLAIFNLLPVPALDGGRILFMILEGIFRRPVVNVKVENIIHIAGFMLLILLAFIVTYHDVMRIFFSN